MDLFQVFIVVFGLMIAGLLAFCVASFVGCFVPKKWETYKSYKLTSLQVNDSISGVFVWGSGTVSGRMTYRSMLVHENGTLSPFSHEVNNENTTLKESGDVQNEGLLTIRHEVADRTAGWMKWAFVECSSQLRYVYVVPRGTVRNQFSVN